MIDENEVTICHVFAFFWGGVMKTTGQIEIDFKGEAPTLFWAWYVRWLDGIDLETLTQGGAGK